eukprot:tig00000654_g2803.t1
MELRILVPNAPSGPASTLQAVARSTGALIVIDDFCDLDAASQKCLAFVAQTGRVCVLATSRKVLPNTVSVEFNMMQHSRHVRHAELGPWQSLDDVTGFVSFVLRIKEENLSRPLAKALAERTGGVPRLLHAHVVHLAKSGLIELDNGRALASAAMLGGPETESSLASGSTTPRHSVDIGVLPAAAAVARGLFKLDEGAGALATASGRPVGREDLEALRPASPAAAMQGEVAKRPSSLRLISDKVDDGMDFRLRQPGVDIITINPSSRTRARDRAPRMQFPTPERRARSRPPLLPISILGRLERIPTVATTVLKLASVLGPRFESGLAQYAIDGVAEWSSIVDCLTVLERHGVLDRRQTATSGLFEYVFADPAHVDVLRKTVDESDAALVAWRAAEYLCRTSQNRNKGAASLVAGYYTAAGAGTLAEPYWEIAAEAELEAGRPAEALAILTAERAGAPPALAIALRPPGGSLASAASATRAGGEALGGARRLELRSRALFSLGRLAEALEARAHVFLAPAPQNVSAADAPHQAVQACLQELGVRIEGRRPLALPVLLAALSSGREAKRGTRREGQEGAPPAAAANSSSLQDAVQRATGAHPEQRRGDVLVAALGTYTSILAHCGDAASAAESALAMVRLARRRSPPAERVDALAIAASAFVRARYRLRTTAALLEGAAAVAAGLPAGALSGPLALAQVRYPARAGSEPMATAPAAARLEFRTEPFPLEALALSAADAACALREGRLQAAEQAALAAVEALRRHRPVGAGFGSESAGRATALHLALLPLLLAGTVLADLLDHGYTAEAAEISWRRTASRRQLLHGGPLLESFADRNLALARDYGETEAGWRRHLRAALRDVVDALRPEAARFPAAAPAYELLEALSGSGAASRKLYRRAAGLAQAAGVRLIEEMATGWLHHCDRAS